MAGFCSQCGAPIEDGANACGKCGAAVATVATEKTVEATAQAASAPESKESKEAPKAMDTTKIIKLIGVAIAAIVVLVIIANIAGKFTGYNGVLRKTVKALQDYDMETLEDVASSIAIEERGDEFSSYVQDTVDSRLNSIEDNVGAIKKISFEITNGIEASSRRVEKFKKDLIEKYNMDSSVIKKIVKLEINLKVKGADKSAIYNVSNIYAIKESSGWKIYYGSLDY